MKNEKQIVCTWSGGIDSTALIANLLKEGYEVFAYRLKIYGNKFEERELKAINKLIPELRKLGGALHFEELDGKFLWSFSPDGIEIPRRNRLIIDHIIETKCKPMKIYKLGLGEYIGADSWVVTDHVPQNDADARALTAYIFNEYGLNFRLITLADYGESRFKLDRVIIGWNVIGELMFQTTNCLENEEVHCGECYKCIERFVAFHMVSGKDITEYKKDPKLSPKLMSYEAQMRNEND